VQLLLATRHSLAARAQRLHIVASNPAVNDVLHTLGLGELLDGERPTCLEGAGT
jgi:anti-anti-sigma regulatory factor